MIETSSEAIEAFHLTFLAHLSKDPNKAVIKGGQNLRLFFESVRHSDDLDMDVSVTSRETLKKNVDKLLASPRFGKALLLYGIEIEQVSTPKQTGTSSLPEVELPDDFDFGKVRNWTRKVPSKRLQTIVERRTLELESG
jgi:hypothetical protein